MNPIKPQINKIKRAYSNNKIILPIYSTQNAENDGIVAKPTIYEALKEFLKNSSLHGLKFIGDGKISIYERGFFLISFIIALSLALHYIWLVYGEWVATPVIIGTNPDSTYINEIPFPAITICNMNQAIASKVKDIKKGSVEYTMLRTLCGRNPEIGDQLINDTRDWSIFQKFIINVAQPCDKMFVSCRYGAVDLNCSHLFRQVITDEGVCCVFNLIDKKFMYRNPSAVDPWDQFNPPNITAVDWSPEDGYERNLPRRFYPRPTAGVGIAMGLSIVLDAQTEEYYCSTTNGAGFKALLHNPAEIPDIANYGFALQVGHETQVVISADIADASYLLRNINRKYRQCVFSDEAYLSHYATYTRRNCELECEAKLHEDRCNCVQYYMPHISPIVNVCGLPDIKCSESVRYHRHETNSESFSCSLECVPACFELKFNTDSYSSHLSHNHFLIKDKTIQNMSEQYTVSNIANVHFFYVERSFRSSTKQQFVGLTEFLSDMGGLVGWFLGFGVLSIAEIIYYVFMRPHFASRRYRTYIGGNKATVSKHLILSTANYHEIKAKQKFMERRFRNRSYRSPH